MSPNAALRGAGRPVVEAGAGRRLARGTRRPPAASAVTFVAAAVAVALAAPALAAVPPELPPELAARIVRHPALDVRNELVSGAGLGAAAAGDLTSLGVAPGSAYLDLATGRWGSLLLAEPMVPGAGNELSWSDLGAAPPAGDRALGDLARHALLGWIARHAAALGIDPAELTPPAVTVHDGGALIQLSGRRIAGGVPVRGAAFTAAIAHGNLVLFGTRNWAGLDVPTLPALAPAEAEAAVAAHLGALLIGIASPPVLELVSAAITPGSGPGGGPGGVRIGHRLVWAVRPVLRAALPGEWEALVDAASGEVLSFADTVHHLAGGVPLARQVIGGHLPRTNDGVPPGGVEDAGAPVPWADLEDDLGVVRFADGGGNLLECVEGTVTSRLEGLLVRILDQCGAIEESTAGAVLDFGTNAGTDCATPPGASAGNTRAARTAYYELSRMKEIALGQLPANAWLGEQLPVETNVNLTCGASWNGSAVRTFRQSGSQCINTGEIASVLDHEWGHGMDDNGVDATISNPSEGIADVYAALRTHESCFGPNFLPSQCNGYGDPCTACTGIRDLDWALRASGQPHDLAWIDANCSGTGAPCGGGVHCEGAVYSEAIWDLYRRDLQGFGGSAFDYEDDTAAEIVTRLTFLGAGPVGGWFDCAPGSAGCAADTGYMNFLAADDDDGDLSNGTPHMSAIFAAFDRHGIACAVPAVADSGCAGTPTAAPVVSVEAADRAVELTWDPIAGASGYAVFRAEGAMGCDQGKVRLGETAGTEWIDSGLQGGRAYGYVVIPKGPAAACFGNGSACTPATPMAGPVECGLLFADGFESGDTTAWTASTP